MEIAAQTIAPRAYPPSTSAHSRINNYAGPTPLMPSQSHQSHSSSSYSSYSHLSARSSDSTQGTSASTLFPPPLPTPAATPVNGAPIEASNNVLNKRAEKETSLFQICLNLRQRLRGVPGVEEVISAEEQECDDDTDPVSLLWRTFRLGYPLMAIYNALNPPVPLRIDESKVAVKNRGKAATLKFLGACLTELKFPTEECFIITDLYGDDTTGFVKVAKVVNRVLDILVQAGVLISDVDEDDYQSTSNSSMVKRTQRQHIIEELVKTERTYVQHLELLQAFKKLVEEKGVITGDQVHDIFLNLNALLDFQRRFLIRVEQTNAQPEDEQNWGKLFVLYRDAFKVYEPYIANQKKCEEVAMREYEKLRETGGPPELRQMVESPTVLSSFLLKPFQRLAKYPLLLKELRDKGDLDDARKADISIGIEAASSVLQRTNAAVDREERNEAVEDLKSRVEDWKGHRIEGFGELLLYGTFTVLKGDSTVSKDSEREYKIYLFEMILLCCKEMNPNKQKNKLMNKPMVTAKGKPKLQLKGRIFMQNVTDAISIGKNGSYTCQIFWKGDPGIENFVIRFTAEDTMKKWAAQVDTQRRLWRNAARSSNSTKQSGTSATEFTYLRDQGLMENPYRQEDEADDDDDNDTVQYATSFHSDYSLPRSESSTSLRSRSATGESGPPPPMLQNGSRAPPPRFPMGIQAPPLSMRTQQLPQGASPGDRPMESYFSPTAETPMSSRTSGSSGMFPFPRQGPMTNGWHGEEHARFTAPATTRTAPRDGQAAGNGYQVSSRNALQRPSLPPNTGSQHVGMTQSRLRSVSSPDIQNPMGPNGRRMINGHHHPPVPDVPVPPFPTHFAYAPGIAPRSQTSSPANPTGVPQSMPIRAATQSPNLQRDRIPQPRNGPDPSHYDYPSAPGRLDPRHPQMSRAATSIDPTRALTPTPSIDPRTLSPPPPSTTPQPDDTAIPTQLKVKVHCPSAGSTMTLVVSTNISYQSLKDRIDAKLQRSTNVSLASGMVKLKYLDEEDFVSIQSDEDVQTAFESWKEQQREVVGPGVLGEIELFCQR